MNVTLPVHAGLARIAGHVAAISAETDRLFGLAPAEGGAGPVEPSVLDEVRAMSRMLAETRSAIISMAPQSGGTIRLHEAGETLDVVVGETERATLEIMHQAERAQAAAARLHAGTSTDAAADLSEVNEAATAIVMACIFQDITDQRIRKVMTALREMEDRVASLVALLGIESGDMVRAAPAETPLMNGPSSAAEGGLQQGAVDDLFG